MGGSSYSDPPPTPVLNEDNVSVNITVNSDISNFAQLDGNDSKLSLSLSSSDNSLSESKMSEYDTEDELEPERSPISVSPVSKPNRRTLKILQASSLPLISVLNCRSLYNKNENFKSLLNELGIEAAIVSESWEREEYPLEKLLGLSNYKVHSYKRPKTKANKQPGGGCAIVYNENRFRATELNIAVPAGVEVGTKAP